MSENGQWTRICRRRGNKALANGVGYAEDCSGAKLELNPVSGRRDAGIAIAFIHRVYAKARCFQFKAQDTKNDPVIASWARRQDPVTYNHQVDEGDRKLRIATLINSIVPSLSH